MEIWTEEWFTDLKIPKVDAAKYAFLFNDNGILESILRENAETLEMMRKTLEEDGVSSIKGGHLRAIWKVLANQPLQPLSPPPIHSPPSIWNTYNKGEKIAKGGFGQVWKGVRKHKETVAIKIIEEGGNLELAEAELKLLKKLENPYIVRLLDYAIEEMQVILVMEHLPKDLKGFLHSNVQNVFGEKGDMILCPSQNLEIFRQILEGLSYLHDQNIAHGDLKCDNILVLVSEEDPSVIQRLRLADFGLARIHEVTQNYTDAGTNYFRAPEVHPQEAYNLLIADVYSFGCVMYQIATGKIRFPIRNTWPTRYPGFPQDVPVHAEPFEKSCNAMLTSMYDRCTAIHPEDRPTVTALLVEIASLNAAPSSESSLNQNADVSLERHTSSRLDAMKPSSNCEAIPSESGLDRDAPASGSSEVAVPHSEPSHMVSGSVYTWGNNQFKMLGYDTPEQVTSVPRMIPQLTKIIQVAHGSHHCLALSEDGDVMSWGTGNDGQLGIENVKECTVPMKISIPERIMSIAAGDHFSLAMSANHVYSWGDNLLGQLGQGPDAPDIISVPREIQGLKAGIKICAGSDHVMLLTREGHLIAWGYNRDGQLGVGDDIDRDVPVPVKCEVSLTDISVGYHHNLGVSSTGQLYSWGYNKYGQLGLRDCNNRYVPTVVPNCPVFDSIQAVGYRSFGLHGTTLYQWGEKIGNVPEKAEGRWNRFAGDAAISDETEVTMPSQSPWNKLIGQQRASSEALLLHDRKRQNLPENMITFQSSWTGVILCHFGSCSNPGHE